MADEVKTRAGTEDPVAFSPGMRTYVLAVLTVVYIFNFIDRQIVVIVQESIKAEMGLSDTQLGLLSGFSFAIFYVTCGIPIARWADHHSRRNVVAVSLALWSAMTALSGMVQNFSQLLLARIGVGVGEAGGSPPAHSIISDYFPFAERGTALAIYSTGIYFGILVGYIAGGWMNEILGWRAAFLLVGLPGILLAVIVRLTVREPPRGYSDGADPAQAVPGFVTTLRVLWGHRSFRYMSLGTGFMAFVGYGNGNFLPSFLARSHGMSSGEIGTWLGLIVGCAGALGTFLGGYLSDRLGRRDARWYMWMPCCGALLAFGLRFGFLLPESTALALGFLFMTVIAETFYLAPSIAASHGLVSPRMRALTSAILFFVLNLIGLGFGPLFTGVMSDFYGTTMGIESLRWAMMTTGTAGLIAAALYVAAGRHFVADLAAGRELQREGNSP